MPKEHIIEQYRRNVVFIGTKSERARGAVSVSVAGTGFVVDGQYVVTSAEVCRKIHLDCEGAPFAGVLERVEQGIDVYQSLPVRFVDVDEVRGIAVFEFFQKKHIGFAMSDLETEEDALRAGVDALVYGFDVRTFSGQKDPKLNALRALVSEVETSFSGTSYLRLEGDLSSVGSGAPLVDVSSTKVVGVIVGTFASLARGVEKVEVEPGKAVFVALPSTEVFDMLDCISAAFPESAEDEEGEDDGWDQYEEVV